MNWMQLRKPRTTDRLFDIWPETHKNTRAGKIKKVHHINEVIFPFGQPKTYHIHIDAHPDQNELC